MAKNWFSSLPPWLTPLTGGILGKGSASDAFLGKNGLFSNPEGAWDNFNNGETNKINYQIAQDNLAYQREANDQNLAFQRETNAQNLDIANRNLQYQYDNLDYQKQLQQQLFEREDTSYQRTAEDMLKAGLNPLTMAGTNGAGEAIATTAPQNNYQKQAEHIDPLFNGFVHKDIGVLQALAGVGSLFNDLQNLFSNGIQRDALKAQRDKMYLENMAFANEHGIDYQSPYSFNEARPRTQREFQDIDYQDKEATKNRNVREDRYQLFYGSHDNATEASRMATDVLYHGDWINNFGRNPLELKFDSHGNPFKVPVTDKNMTLVDKAKDIVGDIVKNIDSANELNKIDNKKSWKQTFKDYWDDYIYDYNYGGHWYSKNGRFRKNK